MQNNSNKDNYNWFASYNDGNGVWENNEIDNGEIKKVSVLELDLDRLIRFTLIPQVEGLRHIVINFNPNNNPRKRPIFFREVCVKTGQNIGKEIVIFGVGWRVGNFQSITRVFPDGTIETTEKDSYLIQEYLESI